MNMFNARNRSNQDLNHYLILLANNKKQFLNFKLIPIIHGARISLPNYRSATDDTKGRFGAKIQNCIHVPGKLPRIIFQIRQCICLQSFDIESFFIVLELYNSMSYTFKSYS